MVATSKFRRLETPRKVSFLEPIVVAAAVGVQMIEKLTACQARAARAMLDWSVRQLAAKSRISDSSIRRVEIGFGVPENVTLDLLVRLQTYFEGRGFLFIWDPAPGVCWNRVANRAGKQRERRNGVADRRRPQ